MKCSFCKKKTHLTFGCSHEGCKYVLCVSCRMPEVHKCAYIVKKSITLPKVIPEKVSKI